jgi:putative ABC transport system permease protein
MDDYRAISSELDSVVMAAPIAMTAATLQYRGQSTNSTVIGTTPEFRYTNNQQPVAGRFIDDIDIRDSARVTVIGADVARKLFFDEQPLGERLLVGGAPYTVIGVLKEKGVEQTGSNQDDRVLVPVSTAMRRIMRVDYVDRIFVQAASRELIGTAMASIEKLLRLRHGLNRAGQDGEEQENDFTITDQASLLKTLRDTDRALSRLLGGIAGLTLGLASLGLLAVSQLSVRERQSEIGLRLAMGALPAQILLQFLAEAMMIALAIPGRGDDDCPAGRTCRIARRRDRHYSQPVVVRMEIAADLGQRGLHVPDRPGFVLAVRRLAGAVRG